MFFCLISVAAAGDRHGPAAQEGPYFDIGLPVGYTSGDTTYHTSSYDAAGNGTESELEFPIKTYLIGLHGELGTNKLQEKNRFMVKMTWLTNLGSGSGKMKDSDWLTDNIDIATVGATHPGKDIYSESDIDLSATIFDVHALYIFHPVSGLSLGPLGGYLYEHFHYDISNTNQVGYGPYNNPPNGSPSFTGVVLGNTLNYEVKYRIPYLGVHAAQQLGDSFQVGMEAGYSPWADAEDRDDHLLRSKLSTGTATGTAYLANLSARWDISGTDFLQLTGSYENIYTKGTQHQYFYAGPFAGQSADVNDKITSSQFSIFLLYIQRI